MHAGEPLAKAGIVLAQSITRPDNRLLTSPSRLLRTGRRGNAAAGSRYPAHA
jgi:hypothetical protein